MICTRVHISTYIQTQTLIFILCKSRELYNGGEGLVYTDVLCVCSHSDPELIHLHCSDALFAQASSFLLLNDVLMLET